MSKWATGVQIYANELKEFLDYEKLETTLENMLNGASDWTQYSYGGSSEIYDDDIAERLATPSEIKHQTRQDGLSSMANARESWLDVQARALNQAARKVLRESKA